MNKKAEDIKLQETTFSNPHGLQNAMNTSSPKDIINMSVYASKN
jgi:D-alanyl-D-alanine carboxypeptidase